MSFTNFCLKCHQFGCICDIVDNAPWYERLRSINDEIKSATKYIEANPYNAIGNTTWLGNAETVLGALRRLSAELSTLLPQEKLPNAK